MAMYDAYIFDLDGTVYLGEALLPGAAETISRIRAAGRPTLFLSNNPTRTRAAYAEKLTRLGIPTSESDVINSSLVMVEWLLQEAPTAVLYVIGEEPLCRELREAGFEHSEQPERIQFVVASFDRTFDYRKLQIAFDAMRAGARLVATNADRYCPVPGGGQPDAAAIIAAIEACTDTHCEVVVGKPSPIMAAMVRVRLGNAAHRCVIVGDRIETDIAMGVAANMDTVLVLTGASTIADLERSPIRPTRVVATIGELLDA
ncbi:MAG: HAD-IIA family hydrolase [Roseiflexaceae bacterium]|nr:HAD-IIA family hydrolase [Roseiflexaceae bacterium]